MDPVPANHDLAAAYRMGELQAHLHAEREAHTRAKYTNGYLLELLSQQHKQAPVDSGAVLLQQRLAAAEYRIRELELELKFSQRSGNGAHKIRARSQGLVHDGSGRTSAAGTEISNDTGKAVNGEAPFSSKCTPSVKKPEEENEAKNGACPADPATDIPLAEWMQPGEKQKEILSGRGVKPQVKRYFGAPTSDGVGGPNSKTAPAAVKDLPSPEPSPTPHRPKHSQEPIRYGQSERDQQRLPRSVARPPAMAGPYYHQHPPKFPRQHLYHFSPHFTTRAPASNSGLPSYADLDRPNVPSFGGPIVHGPHHALPSIGHTGFSEALYDDPSSPSSSSATNAQKTTTTLQHWPVFSDPLHNRRHVELRNLPESASLPAVMRQITGFALLSVSPLRRVAAVVSPFRTAVTHSVTLEFARGDAAAAFVRSTAAVPIELPGSSSSGVVVVEQREQASAPIPRELGEAVWAGGASRALVIEAPGAVLRVPANLRFQIENCAYAPRGRGEEGGAGEACGLLLLQPPAFFEDGAIGVVFRDVRDAVVAHRAWLRSPIFRNVGVGFEREGVLPELEADGEEGGKGRPEGRPESEVEVERKGEEGESGEDGGATGATTSTASSVGSTTGVGKEEDGGYVAGSSEDPEDSAAILGKPLTRSIEHFDAGDVDVGSETSTDGDDDENEKNRGPTIRPIIKQDAFLNYDGSSDGLEEGEIYEHPVTAPATSPFAPPTSLTPKHVSAITRAVATSSTPAIQSGPDGETQVFRTPGGTLFKPGTTSPGCINELMGRSRWAS
ncbi:hypothetical protein SLS56_001911 [Neofusicoccum ribis]|uniref:Uncharacterized protein n=1 Tax=Neofusicoccum ribis TaxID=45134 RepID=A0ABR3T6F2_9PEZI